MTVETIDLYDYFKLPRCGAEKGILTAYCHGQLTELQVKKRRAAMLVFPGGGYAGVSQREAEPVALRYFADGFDAFVLDYDVAPKHYPLQILQAGMAMLYIRREAGARCIDDKHIAAVGFSAGGHLCGCVSFLWDDPALVQAFGAEECEKIRPDAALLSYPVITFDERYRHYDSFVNFCGDAVKKEDYSLEKRIRPSVPPCFIWANTPDGAVPPENSVLLYSALRRAGVPAELHIFEQGWHGMSLCNGEVEPEDVNDAVRAHVSHWIGLSVEFLRAHGFDTVTVK